MDALTEVFGMEKGGFVKGVGYGLTKSNYWPGCRAKNGRSADKQIIEHLKSQLENERMAHLKKDAHLKDLSARMTETQNQFAEVLACLTEKGITLSKPNDIPSPAQPAVSELLCLNIFELHFIQLTFGPFFLFFSPFFLFFSPFFLFFGPFFCSVVRIFFSPFVHQFFQTFCL